MVVIHRCAACNTLKNSTLGYDRRNNISSSFYSTVPLSLFPLNNYSQQVDVWIDSSAEDYDTPLVWADYQLEQTNAFYENTFGASSP